MHHARAPFPAVLLLFAFACSKAPSAATLPLWTATDHDHSGTPNADQAAAPIATAASAPAQSLGAALWDRQCSTCHGPTGRGDGPMAAALHPPNMSLMAWQKSKTDAELLASIRNGKGAMPRFSLADDALAAALAQVRSFVQK